MTRAKELTTEELFSRIRLASNEEILGELLEELVTRHRRLVYGITMSSTTSADNAAEAFQETFLRLVRWLKKHRSELPPPRDFEKLLATLAHRASIDLARKSGHYPQALPQDLLDSVAGPGSSPGDTAIEVNRLLETLGPEERELIEFRYLQGLRATEIAELTGHSAASVRVAIHRALSKLRESQHDQSKGMEDDL